MKALLIRRSKFLLLLVLLLRPSAAYPTVNSGKQSLDCGTILTESFEAGEISLKWAYEDNGVNHYAAVSSAKSYKLIGTEIDLIRAQVHSETIKINLTKRWVLVDIGPGDGQKAIAVLEHFQNLGLPAPAEYHSVDISPGMLRQVSERMHASQPNILISNSVSDFEDPHFYQNIHFEGESHDSPKLWMLLGQTLGNPIDRVGALKHIVQAMHANDALAIGVDLFSEAKIEETLASYRTAAGDQFVFEPLRKMGFSLQQGKMNVSFDTETHTVVGQFVFKEIAIASPEFGKTLVAMPGKTVTLFRSHRFTITELRGLAQQAGLDISSLLIDQQKNYALLMAKKP